MQHKENKIQCGNYIKNEIELTMKLIEIFNLFSSEKSEKFKEYEEIYR